MPGKGKLIITGKLGDVMQESAQAAMSYVRSRADALGLERDFYQKVDIHIHVPEGAIPKDGPSAGITMATALDLGANAHPRPPRSCHDRRDHACAGASLPIGGLKEKVLAAHRGGIKHSPPSRGERQGHQARFRRSILKSVRLELVDHMDTGVLRKALVLV